MLASHRDQLHEAARRHQASGCPAPNLCQIAKLPDARVREEIAGSGVCGRDVLPGYRHLDEYSRTLINLFPVYILHRTFLSLNTSALSLKSWQTLISPSTFLCSCLIATSKSPLKGHRISGDSHQTLTKNQSYKLHPTINGNNEVPYLCSAFLPATAQCSGSLVSVLFSLATPSSCI